MKKDDLASTGEIDGEGGVEVIRRQSGRRRWRMSWRRGDMCRRAAQRRTNDEAGVKRRVDDENDDDVGL